MRWKPILLYLITSHSFLALARETVGLPGLQTGPVGNGYVFEPEELLGEEFVLKSITITGREKSPGTALKYRGETLSLKVAKGFKATDSVSVMLQIDHDKKALRAEGISRKETHKTTSSEIRVGPNIWLGDLLIGAHASALHQGVDMRSSQDTNSNSEVKTGAVTIPRLRLFTGIRSGSVSAMLRSLLYSHASTTRTTSTTTSSSQQKVKRRMPAEMSIDTRIVFDPRFSLAGSVTYFDAERASDDNMNNYFSYGLGGLYAASTNLFLAASMHYTDPSYKRGSDASIIADNLGGINLDLGTRYLWNTFAVSFDAGYTLPEPAEYQTDQSRNIVKLERAQWSTTLGLKTNW